MVHVVDTLHLVVGRQFRERASGTATVRWLRAFRQFVDGRGAAARNSRHNQ
jgi:hypothetical protein